MIRANLHEKTQELEALNAVVSWDYYEVWHFTSLDQAREQMVKQIERPRGDIVGLLVVAAGLRLGRISGPAP